MTQLGDLRQIHFGQSLQNVPLTITVGADRTNGDLGPPWTGDQFNGFNTDGSDLYLGYARRLQHR